MAGASRGVDLTEYDGLSSEVRGELTGAPMPDRVEVVAVAGLSAPTLIDPSGDADLLVVGSRGRGGFANMAMGSTSLQCVLHARCPVTVVRRARVEVEKPVSDRPRFKPLRIPLS